MTVISNDDPEIVLGGGDHPAPSAPPLRPTLDYSIAPTATTGGGGLPTAIGTPILQPTAPSLSPPPPAATNYNTPTTTPTTTTTEGGNIERTTNADGSLSIKITTTTPQPNGYRELQIEYFHIPASTATTVHMALDAGEKPSMLYMTKMEQQQLPPGTGEVMSRPPTNTNQSAYPTPGYEVSNETVQPGGGGGGMPNQQNTTAYGSNNNNGLRACGICCGVACVIFVMVAIVGGATSSSSNSSYSPPSPSWSTPYPFPTPNAWNPSPTPPWWSHPSIPTSRPTYWYEKQPSLFTTPPTTSPRPSISPRALYRHLHPNRDLHPKSPTAAVSDSSPVVTPTKSDSSDDKASKDSVNKEGDDYALVSSHTKKATMK